MSPPGQSPDAFGNEIHIHFGVWDSTHGKWRSLGWLSRVRELGDIARHEGDDVRGPFVGREVDGLVGHHIVHRGRATTRSGTKVSLGGERWESCRRRDKIMSGV